MKRMMIAAVFALLAADAAAAEKGKDSWKEKVFTAEELKKLNGKSGRPVYVAVDGVVYDLSGVQSWKGGSHMNMHEAGEDLSEDIKNRAPKGIHKGGAILSRYPKVGVLAPAPEKAEAERPVVAGPWESEIGLERFCPVMEHGFVVEAKTQVVVYKGERYFMCCPACSPQFAKDPEKFIKGEKMKAEKRREKFEREKRERAEKQKKKKSGKDGKRGG